MTSSKPPQKVNLYSLPELKSAVDEALPAYLATLPAPYTFKQDHTLANVRLALGYSAVLIAGLLFYIDWKQGWDVTKPYTLPACVLYFALNGAMTLWVWIYEAGTVFAGAREGGQKLKLSSHVTKPTPEYVLTIQYTSPGGDKVWQNNAVSVPFAQLFNTHGYLQKKELHKFLAKKVEVIGLADPASKSAKMEYLVEADGGAAEEGDTIEVDVVGANNASGSLIEDAGSTPARRAPGRPKKKV